MPCLPSPLEVSIHLWRDLPAAPPYTPTLKGVRVFAELWCCVYHLGGSHFIVKIFSVPSNIKVPAVLHCTRNTLDSSGFRQLLCRFVVFLLYALYNW